MDHVAADERGDQAVVAVVRQLQRLGLGRESAHGQGRPEDIEQLIRISKANDGTTICGMGDAAGYATVGILAKYRDEFEYYIEHKRSRLGGRRDLTQPVAEGALA